MINTNVREAIILDERSRPHGAWKEENGRKREWHVTYMPRAMPWQNK